MEKKNTILLTVIAIATLLVAVVGATFAYFTATITTTNDTNATTEVKTAALTSVSFDYGKTISSTNGVVYPGYKDAKEMHLVGSCPAGQTDCQDVNTTITVTANIDSDFGTDVTWSLYESATPISAVTVADGDGYTLSTNGLCATKLNTVNNQYSMDAKCPSFSGSAILTGNATDATGKTKQVTVSKTTDTYYYLVVDYKNDTTQAQNAQGKTFSVTMDYDSTNVTVAP